MGLGVFNLFRRSGTQEQEAAAEADPVILPDIGEGRRVYAIGDVHGRRDLLLELLEKIATDTRDRGYVRELRFVLLGDLIDRGPESGEVINIVLAMIDSLPGTVCLKGNHEEVFIAAMEGDLSAMRFFRRLGRDTLISYGIDGQLIDEGSDEALHAAMMAQVPKRHRGFLATLPTYRVIGDYLFVHAGIRPGIALEEQDDREMRWIRGDFLTHGAKHPHMVIHGHSITDAVDEQSNRIGIDTGAYFSEKLTAIGLEGTDRWFLST